MSAIHNKLPILCFSGPSGSGKSTLITKLFTNNPNKYLFSVSHTTRSPRKGEVCGKDYHFINQIEFEKMIKGGMFVEHANFSNNFYDVDIQGVKQLKSTNIEPRIYYIFIMPPSFESLKQRLINRGTETEESLKSRLSKAEAEIEYAKTNGNMDTIIVNDKLETAYNELEEYINKIFIDYILKSSL